MEAVVIPEECRHYSFGILTGELATCHTKATVTAVCVIWMQLGGLCIRVTVMLSRCVNDNDNNYIVIQIKAIYFKF